MSEQTEAIIALRVALKPFATAFLLLPEEMPRHLALAKHVYEATAHLNEQVSPGGVELIAEERARQVTDEGYSAEHDDEHDDGDLALAAACYATPVRLYERRDNANGYSFSDPFPAMWDNKRFSFHPSNSPPDPSQYSDEHRLSLLVKAGALIAAEIDRLLRLPKEIPKENDSDFRVSSVTGRRGSGVMETRHCTCVDVRNPECLLHGDIK